MIHKRTTMGKAPPPHSRPLIWSQESREPADLCGSRRMSSPVVCSPSLHPVRIRDPEILVEGTHFSSCVALRFLFIWGEGEEPGEINQTNIRYYMFCECNICIVFLCPAWRLSPLWFLCFQRWPVLLYLSRDNITPSSPPAHYTHRYTYSPCLTVVCLWSRFYSPRAQINKNSDIKIHSLYIQN